jgi:hypothetical protein
MIEVLQEKQISYKEIPFSDQPKHRLLKSKRNFDEWVKSDGNPNYDIEGRREVLVAKYIPLPRLNEEFHDKLLSLRSAYYDFEWQVFQHEEVIASIENERGRRAAVHAKQYNLDHSDRTTIFDIL